MLSSPVTAQLHFLLRLQTSPLMESRTASSLQCQQARHQLRVYFGLPAFSSGDTIPHAGVLNIQYTVRPKSNSGIIGAALVTQVSPKVEFFSLDLIILSDGFDAHVNDPLGMGRLPTFV